MKILSIDDSKMVHMVIAKALKPFAVNLLTALHGEEGLAKAKEEKPDLIILDITMPVLDGLETLARLQQDADTRPIPVLMLSADGGKDSIERALQMGAVDFLTKPFTGEALILALSNHIGLAQAA